MAAGTTQGGKASKTRRRTQIGEVVRYALGHQLRVYVLILLNEGEYSVAEMAEIIGVDVKLLANHVKELDNDGAIELARTEPVRGSFRHIYRAVEMPMYSDEDIERMTPGQRQVTAGLVCQSMIAEILGSLEDGKMSDDLRVHLFWNWFHVDELGRQRIADVQAESIERFNEIEAEAMNRIADSGEETQSILVSQTGFERSRKGPFRGGLAGPDQD